MHSKSGTEGTGEEDTGADAKISSDSEPAYAISRPIFFVGRGDTHTPIRPRTARGTSPDLPSESSNDMAASSSASITGESAAKRPETKPDFRAAPTVVGKGIAKHSDESWKTRITKVRTIRPDTDSGEACLVLLHPPSNDMGRRYTLARDEIFIGRDSDCDIQIDRNSVSRRHARIFRSGDRWHLEDLQSTNGSYVNDISIQSSLLSHGDFAKVGGAILKFLAGAGIEASYHEEIYKITIVDTLTGTYNKRYLLEFLERELIRSSRHGHPLSLIMFGIDHLKSINVKHGHLTSDYVLREIPRRLSGRVRREELLARYSDEEFAVVLPVCDLTNARTLGERICQLISERPFEFEGATISVSTSVGIASLEGEGLDVMSFIRLAEDNLYRAKREGRNRVVTGTGEWHRWKADPSFRIQPNGKTAIAALSILARDQILASSGGVAHVDDLEGLLYTRLCEQQKSDQALSFGALEGGNKLLVALEGRNSVHHLRIVLFEALRRCAEECPEAQFAVGPVRLAKPDTSVIEGPVMGLDEEIGILENGRHLSQPLAVALRALDDMDTTRAKSVLDLGETLLQWLSLCAVAELDAHGARGLVLTNLRWCCDGSTSMQRWYVMLVNVVQTILEIDAIHSRAWRACFGDQSSRDELFDYLRSLVNLWNAFPQDATASDERVARQIIDEVPHLCQLIKRELRPILALIPAEVELVGFEGELQSYRMTRLIGNGMAASVPMYSRRRMNPGLWLCDVMADRALCMEPFFVRDTCPKCGARELFLLSRLDELEFRNPASGHVLKKPIDDLPLSLEARERLMELVGPTSSGAPASPIPETAERAALLVKLPEHGASPPEGRRGSRPDLAPAPQGSARMKHTILFLAANPTGTDRLALDREARAIQVELERSGFRDCFELVTRWAAEPLDLLRELRRLRPTVIHFSGRGSHGTAEAPEPADGRELGLYFQGSDGRAQLVSTQALGETFGAAGTSVKLVVLNACYSEVQAEALLAHVDCVVGVGGSIREDAARNFAIGFYGGLGERESVAVAYKQGRAAISLEGLRDDDRPQLKIRAGVDASQLVLAVDRP
jgi:two-component system, cell cycle response regulator